jgi:hypothetical protein
LPKFCCDPAPERADERFSTMRVTTPRAMHEEADRARFYAHLIGDEAAAQRLRQYAAELEAMAEAAEPAVAPPLNPKATP